MTDAGCSRREAIAELAQREGRSSQGHLRRRRARQDGAESESSTVGNDPGLLSCFTSMSTPLHFVILAAGKGTRMKSELPKVLHAVGGEPMIVPHPARRPATSSRRPRPSWSVTWPTRCGPRWRRFRASGTVVQEPQLGTAHALHAGRAAAGRPDRHRRAALRRRAAARRATRSRGLLEHHQRHRRRGDRADRPPAEPDRLRPHRPRRTAASPASSRSATRRRPRRRSPRSTAASTPSTLDGAVRRAAPDRHRQRPGRVLPDRPGRHLPRRRPARRDALPSTTPTSCAASTAAPSWPLMNAHRARPAQRRGDGRRRHADRSGHGLDRPGRRDRAGHGRSTRTSTWKGKTRIGARLRDPRRRPHRRLDDRRRRRSCRTTASSATRSSSAGARWARSRTSGPTATSATGAHVGNFVELKKTTLGTGSKANHLAYLGDATIGAKVNVGAGDDHLQLRRREQAPDRDRGRRVHRQRLAAGRAGDGRRGRLRRRRDRRSPRTCPPARSAIARGRQENKAGWVAKRKGKTPAKSSGRTTSTRGDRRIRQRAQHHVRNRRLHRREAGRSGPRRGAAAARVPRLRLGRRRGGRTGRHRGAAQRRQALAPRGRAADRRRSPATTASATRAGRRTAGRPRRTPTRTATAPAASSSSTTASSRTTSS